MENPEKKRVKLSVEYRGGRDVDWWFHVRYLPACQKIQTRACFVAPGQGYKMHLFSEFLKERKVAFHVYISGFRSEKPQ